MAREKTYFKILKGDKKGQIGFRVNDKEYVGIKITLQLPDKKQFRFFRNELKLGE